MISHRKLSPPTNIRRTLSNRKATPLSLAGEMSMQHMFIVFVYLQPCSTRYTFVVKLSRYQGDRLLSDPKKYFVWEVYFCQKKYIFNPERSTGCLYKLSRRNLMWGPLKCSKSNFNPVHVFLHFNSFCLGY